MLSRGPLLLDAAGRIVTVQPGGPVFFNGGTPTDAAGRLVVDTFEGDNFSGGLNYTDDDALHVVPNITASFRASLMTTLVAEVGGAPTFQRGSIATVIDHDGVVRYVPSNAARFHGARGVFNTVVNCSNPSALGSVTKTDGQTDPDGGSTATKVEYAVASSSDRIQYPSNGIGYPGPSHGSLRAVVSVYLKGAVGGEAVKLWDGWSNRVDCILTTEWQRFTVPSTLGASSASVYLYALSAPMTVYVAFPQSELVTGATDQSPSEYVSVGVLSYPYHGAGVDGLKYFASVDELMYGVVIEGERTNVCLYSADLSNAVWANASTGVVTPTADYDVGADGSQTATRLVGGAADIPQWAQTCITSAGQTYVFSFWAKANDGSTTLNVVAGSQVIPITIDSTLTRYAVKVNAPAGATPFGWRLANNQDITVWGAQTEQGDTASSYIQTADAAVTCQWDKLTYPSAGAIAAPHIAMYAECSVLPGHLTYGGTPTACTVSATNYTSGSGALLRWANNSSAVFGGNNSATPAVGPTGLTLAKIAGKGNDTDNSMAGFALGLMSIGAATFDWTGVGTTTINIGNLSSAAPVQTLFGAVRNVIMANTDIPDDVLMSMTS
jgi:hypothetical protein